MEWFDISIMSWWSLNYRQVIRDTSCKFFIRPNFAVPLSSPVLGIDCAIVYIRPIIINPLVRTLRFFNPPVAAVARCQMIFVPSQSSCTDTGNNSVKSRCKICVTIWLVKFPIVARLCLSNYIKISSKLLKNLSRKFLEKLLATVTSKSNV